MILTAVSLYERVALKKGDRVIVNLGSAKAPNYYTAIVTKLNGKAKRVTIRTDFGKSFDKIVSNTPTGIVGYARNKRTRETPIDSKHLLFWLDMNRWHANINWQTNG